MPNQPQLPPELLNSLSKREGFNTEAFVEAHAEKHKLNSLRLNPLKKTELDFELNEPIAWCRNAYYLNERPSFTHDPLFHAGCYYVQEAGSMFLEQALRQTLELSQNLKVLDLCAAPGGKSTLINSLLTHNSLLVANEIIKSRADILAQNLSKWGTSNTIVTNSDPSKLGELSGYFDAIVVDAPCSGSGLFRKQPEAVGEWSENAVQACSLRQKTILSQILPALKEGGVLVYSTCSYSEEENENIVNWLLAEHGLSYQGLNVAKDWGIDETAGGYRFYPHLTKSEGFFCAVLKKPAGPESLSQPRKIKMDTTVSLSEKAIITPFLNMEEHLLMKKNERFYLLNTAALEFLSRFGKQFYFKKAGCCIGEIKGKDLVPDQELAWSNHLHERIQRLDLTRDDALNYLKKEKLTCSENFKGFVAFTYKNYTLGWAKLLPNRVNNYYPVELRVLK